MNKSIRVTILAVAVVLASQATQAADNDLVLGFTGNGGASDYLINLGQASTMVGGTAVVDLTGYFNRSTFDGIFTAGPNGTSFGVGGGTASTTPSVFLTQTRIGGPGVPAIAGSSTPADQTLSNASARAADFNQVLSGYASLSLAGGSATPLNTDAASFSQAIYGGGGLLGQQGINISSLISGGTVYADLYQTTQVGTGFSASDTYSYAGYFTMNFNNNTLTFTPMAVPEPGTWSLLACAGLAAFKFRRQIRRKTV